MFPERLKQKLAQPLIVSVNDDARVFFPFGPLRGYLLPKPAYESIVSTSHLKVSIASFGSLVAIFVIPKVFNIHWALLHFVAIMCPFIGYYFRTKRIARHLVPLPRAVSMRVYSRALGPYACEP